MKGTILDFLRLARENEELAREFIALAKKYEFEFKQKEELSEEELEGLSGGVFWLWPGNWNPDEAYGQTAPLTRPGPTTDYPYRF